MQTLEDLKEVITKDDMNLILNQITNNNKNNFYCSQVLHTPTIGLNRLHG